MVKRNRTEAQAQVEEVDVDSAVEEVAAASPPQTQAERDTDRRAGMANIARKRAAHFAHFKDSDDEADGDNVHVGTDDARRLGPWSSAVELVNARSKAQQDREDRIQAAARAERDALEWQPSRDVTLGPHPTNAVPLLFDSCLDVLTKYIDCVESLWGVPDAIKVRLAAHVCATRRMSPEVAQLFSACSAAELVLPDCVQLDAPAMSAVLKECATAKLQRLELSSCGRGFGDESAAMLASRGPFPELTALTLAGAYRLTDAGLLKVLQCVPNLTSLSLPQASRITGGLLDKLPQLVPKLRHLDLTDCRGIGAESLAAVLPQLVCLRSLTLDGNPEADDAVVLAASRQASLRDLSIRYCQAVTDAGLTAVAATRPELEALRIDECTKVTDKGIHAIASQCKGLKVLSARRCARLGDEAVASVASRCSLQQLVVNGCTNVGAATIRALATCCKETLELLDVSFCRRIPDDGLGLLLDRCTRLQHVSVFGLNQMTTRSLYGHSNERVKVEGLHTSINRTGAGAL